MKILSLRFGALLAWVAGLASAGLVAAMWAGWPGAESSEPKEGKASSAIAPVGTTPPEQPVAGRLVSPMPTGDVSLSRQVQELVATRDPEKLYLAYGLLAGCVEFNRDHDRMIYDEGLRGKSAEDNFGYRHMTEQEKAREIKSCGAMTERERQSRLEYLAAAARAGVPGSAISFLREGPFGDPSALQTRPNDPLVQEWKTLAKAQLTAEADAGKDLAAVNYIATEYAAGSLTFEQNGRLAYRYFLANGLIHKELFGPDSDVAEFFAEDSALMASIGQDLSPAERAAETAAAKQIAENFRKRRAPSN